MKKWFYKWSLCGCIQVKNLLFPVRCHVIDYLFPVSVTIFSKFGTIQ